jgi:type IV secretion system protein VirB4
VHPNVRRPLLHSLNYADLLPTAAQFTGLVHNPSPLFPDNAPALLHAATGGATPFRLNLHVSDVGHTLVFGPTGAGKSVLLATLTAQFMRYSEARITVFDKGLSMFALAKAIEATGGNATHYRLADDRGSVGMCPLAFLESPGDVAWAEEWLATCYELQTEEKLSPNQKGEIHRAITSMARTQADESRTLTDFLTTVQDEDIRQALRAYTIDGPLGELLDARSDGLKNSRFTVFELDVLLSRPDHNVIPVLLTLFRRFEQSLTGAPALLVLDEAWVMLGHPVFREKLREWLKTLRKANCAVVMATQSLSDAWRSGLLDVLMESCPTKIFLANAEAHKRGSGEVLGPCDIYTAFGLNEVEIDILANATPKRDYYYTSPLGRRPFELALGPTAHAFTAVSSKEDIARIEALIASHGQDWPQEWLKERKGYHDVKRAA